MIVIDYKDRRPIYEQIMAGIEDLAARGALSPDSQLPSVRQLAMELSINPNTIQRAYSELEKAGVIYSVTGTGNFVTADPGSLREEKLRSLLEEMTRQVVRAMELGATEEQLGQWLRQAVARKGGNNHDTSR